MLSLSASPVSAGDVHRDLFPNQENAPKASRTSAVMRRLVDAGAAAEIGYAKFVITPIGRALQLELPMSTPEGSGAETPGSDGQNDEQSITVEAIASELISASTDNAHPDRFERATEVAFRLLGIEAIHIGGAGATDVLLTVKSNLVALGRVIVDSKTAASGQLREDSVVIDTLKEHAAKHGADRIAVVAPGYDNSGRLPARASSNGVVLLTAAQLTEMVRAHQLLPFSPQDILDVLTVDRVDDVSERREVEEGELALLRSVLVELRAESIVDAAEPITPRDIYRLLRKDDSVTEAGVTNALRFLSDPRIAAVKENDRGGFTLPSDLHNAAIRLRRLADVIDAASGDGSYPGS